MFETIMRNKGQDNEFFIFFVLGGFENGHRDFPCFNSDGTKLADGFYFGVEDCEDPCGGPFSRQSKLAINM
jgi:hypothetical protein